MDGPGHRGAHGIPDREPCGLDAGEEGVEDSGVYKEGIREQRAKGAKVVGSLQSAVSSGKSLLAEIDEN